LGTNRAAIGSFFPGDGVLSGPSSDVVVEFTGCKGLACFPDPRADKLYVGGGLDTADAENWGFDCDDVEEEAEDGVIVDEVKGAVEGRRCITVFTVTRLESFKAGNNGGVASDLASMRKFRPLDGMGGIIRALYMVRWILEASDFVF
jgi:hypothetical protein